MDIDYGFQFKKAFDKSIKYLTIKSRTEYELRKKLEQNGFDKNIIDNVILKLKELNYINDEEYVRLWIEEKIKIKPSGKKTLISQLCNKGIATELAIKAVENTNIDDFETAIEILNRKFRLKDSKVKNSREYSKIYRFLLSKGIGYSTASKAIRIFFTDIDNNCE